MDKKRIDVDGKSFDLDDPEQKMAAIRAWLKAKSKGKSEGEPAGPSTSEDKPLSNAGKDPADPDST